MDLKVEFAVFTIAEQFKIIDTNMRGECQHLTSIASLDTPDTSLQANLLTFSHGEVLYSLQCPERLVYLATYWNSLHCY